MMFRILLFFIFITFGIVFAIEFILRYAVPFFHKASREENKVYNKWRKLLSK